MLLGEFLDLRVTIGLLPFLSLLVLTHLDRMLLVLTDVDRLHPDRQRLIVLFHILARIQHLVLKS